MHRHDLIIKIKHFVVIACSLNQNIHSLTVRMHFSFCCKRSFDFCGKSNWCVAWISSQAYSLKPSSQMLQFPTAQNGYLKLKLDCISGFLHPECDVLFLGFSALSPLNFQKTILSQQWFHFPVGDSMMEMSSQCSKYKQRYKYDTVYNNSNNNYYPKFVERYLDLGIFLSGILGAWHPVPSSTKDVGNQIP